MIYCANCEAEAVKAIEYPSVRPKTPLCFSCATAYEWGQSTGGSIVDLEEGEDETSSEDETSIEGEEDEKCFVRGSD